MAARLRSSSPAAARVDSFTPSTQSETSTREVASRARGTMNRGWPAVASAIWFWAAASWT